MTPFMRPTNAHTPTRSFTQSLARLAVVKNFQVEFKFMPQRFAVRGWARIVSRVATWIPRKLIYCLKFQKLSTHWMANTHFGGSKEGGLYQRPQSRQSVKKL